MTNWKADPKVQEILAGFGHGEVTFGGKREGLTMQIRTATEAEIDALLEAAVAASGSTGGAPTRDELAKLISEERTKSHWRGYDMTNLDLADAILARWPAASRVPSDKKPAKP